MNRRNSLFATTLFSIIFSFSALAATPQLPSEHLRVPLVKQATDYSCGPASFLGVLMYWQEGDIAESALYRILGTTAAAGTNFQGMVRGATRYGKEQGLEVEAREHLSVNDLRQYLAKGTPVILNIQAWHSPQSENIPWRDIWEDGHYLVLIALDADFAYFMDPTAPAGYAYMPLGELEDRWHDYDVVHGKKVVADHAGIAIHGKNALTTNPGPLIRIN